MEANEVAAITAAHMGNFLTAFTVFLSIATAYLIAAYLVGKKLTNLQKLYVEGTNITKAGITKLKNALPDCRLIR